VLTLGTHEIFIHDVFRSRLISENVCCYPVQKFFSVHICTENLKIKISKVLGRLL